MIEIKKFKEGNIETLISWIKTPEELMQFAGPNFQFPLTKDQILESLENKNVFPFSIIEKSDNKMIGYAEIKLKEHSFALARILIGEIQNRGKGYGKIITRKLLNFGFGNFDKEYAELNVFDWNVPAIKAYEKVGFKINPNEKFERHINGNIWIALNMTLNKNEYLKAI